MPLVKMKASAHYYDPATGEPRHFVDNASKPGEMRKTNLRDARKHLWVAGVNDVLSVVPKFNLTRWQIETAIEAALTTERGPAEGLDAFASRVAEEAASVSAKAADWGTGMHEVITDWEQTQEGTTDPHYAQALKLYDGWRREHVAEVLYLDQPFAANGYGGTLDMIANMIDGRPAVIDFKTQRTKPGQKFRSYETYPLQLVAYAFGFLNGEYRSARLINVMISSNKDDPRIEMIEYTDHKYLHETWCAALNLYCLLKKYDPRKKV